MIRLRAAIGVTTLIIILAGAVRAKQGAPRMATKMQGCECISYCFSASRSALNGLSATPARADGCWFSLDCGLVC